MRHEQFTGVVCVSGGLMACETGGIKVLSDSKGADSSTSGLMDCSVGGVAVSPIVGKVVEIIPRSAQARRLR